MLRPVRTDRRTTPARPAAPLARRLPLVAAAVVAAGLTAACGPTSSQSAGSAAASVAGRSSEASPSSTESTATESPAQDPSASAPASPSASASASAPASSAASAPGSATSPARGTSGSAAPARTAAKPARTSTAPKPPAKVPGPGYPTADAGKAIDAALRAAKADGRAVLLDFGANWCGNCKAADKVFAQAKTSEVLGSSYHLVKIDIGGNSSANSALLRKYSPGGGTYKMPVLVVVSPSGSVRTDTHVTGNPSLTADGLNSFLRKWAS
ncbi:thioredoxin family protein [Streptomyces sp. NPDC089799]|uniref:thioredoxin family protein n=1 Tax=Streptomyces sp. NPDC089799 TaxID=3155066 RepID=UPI00341A1F10